MITIAVVFPLLLLLAAVLAELASSGKLKRNWIAGIRTSQTRESDAAWVAGHRAARKALWIGFAASAVAGMLALVTQDAVSITFTVVVVVALVATVATSLVQANRASTAVTA